jgi:SAM-dependent methyltransferase
MKRYFDKANNRLVYVGETANSTYWDQHWQRQGPVFHKQPKIKGCGLVVGNTKKYLPIGARILEGGCGRGTNVHALHYYGYDTYGIDYAKKTVEAVNKCAPELKVMFGDIRDLPFPDDFFDGYWSLGVIEHFYDGYEKIASEMFRVLKPEGYLFLTVPVMSPLRKVKVRLKKYIEYEYKESEEIRDNFYQFAFDHRAVIDNLENKGFRLIALKPYGGIKGLKDEVSILKPSLQRLYDKENLSSKLVKKILDIVFRHFTNHMCLFAMRKAGINWKQSEKHTQTKVDVSSS